MLQPARLRAIQHEVIRSEHARERSNGPTMAVWRSRQPALAVGSPDAQCSDLGVGGGLAGAPEEENEDQNTAGNGRTTATAKKSRSTSAVPGSAIAVQARTSDVADQHITIVTQR